MHAHTHTHTLTHTYTESQFKSGVAMTTNNYHDYLCDIDEQVHEGRITIDRLSQLVK